jgi:DNA primase
MKSNSRDKCQDRDPSDRLLQPLTYELTLDPSHPYLVERGIGPELAALFGLGYCSRGTMKGRICIPIHDERGVLVAYTGRWASEEIPQDVPKYHLPRGFEKRRVLFGLHRVAGAEHVVLVEGYWSVFRLHALKIPAVALMGRTLSPEQETLLIESRVQMLTLMLDGDTPGREATDELLPRLAKPFFVRVICLPDGAEPDTVSEQFLIEVLCNRR